MTANQTTSLPSLTLNVSLNLPTPNKDKAELDRAETDRCSLKISASEQPVIISSISDDHPRLPVLTVHIDSQNAPPRLLLPHYPEHRQSPQC